MDKLIVLILLFFVFRKVFAFLSKEDARGKATYRRPPPHQMPERQPLPGHGHKGRRDVQHTQGKPVPETWSDLIEIIKEAKGESAHPQHPPQTMTPRVEERGYVEERSYKKEKLAPHTEGEIERGAAPQEAVSPPPQGVFYGVEAGEGSAPMDSHGQFRQGIIMSEILRAPVARRKPFLLPYMRV